MELKNHQANLFGNDLMTQLNPNDPLVLLAKKIPWETLESSLSKYYQVKGSGDSNSIIFPSFS